MKRGATSIEKAFAGVAVLAVVGLIAVAAALAGPRDMPPAEADAPIITDSALGDGTAAISVASGEAVARSVLVGRRYDPNPSGGGAAGERIWGQQSASWVPSS